MKDFPLIRSVRAAVIGTLLLVLPLLLLSSSLLDGIYLAALIVFLGPAALCLAAAVCGALPLTLGAAAALFSMGRVFGIRGMLLTAVYLLPVIALFFVIVLRRVPFWKACAMMVGMHVASFTAIYLILQQWTGGALYETAAHLAMDALSRWEFGDEVLYQFYAMGLIKLPASLADGVALSGGYFTMSEAARQDLILSVGSLVSSTLMSLVPGTIIARQSLLGGVGCLLLSLRFGYLAQRKRQTRAIVPAAPEADGNGGQEDGGAPSVDFPDLGMPDFSRWFIPRGVGWQVGAALLLGALLQRNNLPALAIAGIILYSVGDAVFTIQGAAMINYSQKARGTKRFWRVLVPALLISTSLLMVVGIMEQIGNFRGLRKPLGSKEEF